MALSFSVFNKFKAIDGVTAPVRKMTKNVGRFGKTATKAFRRSDRQAKKLNKTLKGILVGGGILGGVALLTRGISSVTTQFVEFDDSIIAAGARFKDIGPDVDDFTDRIKGIKKAAREAGATTEFTAAQSAKSLDFLARAGFKSTEAIGSLVSMINLATASGEDFAAVADMSSDLLGAFGLNADNTAQKIKNLNRLNDVLVKTVNTANVTITDMFETMKQVGPIATGVLGASLEEVAALTAVLGSSGIKGSEAMTALKNAYLRLAAPTSGARKLMNKFNISLDDGKGGVRKMTDVLSDLGGKISGLSKIKQAQILNELFGKRAIAGGKNLIDNIKNIKEFEKSLRSAGGTSQKTADLMRTSLGNRLKTLNSALIEFGFKILENFRVKGTDALIAFTEAIRNVDVKPIIAGISGLIKVSVVLFKTLAFIASGYVAILDLWNMMKIDLPLAWEHIKKKVFDPFLKAFELISSVSSKVGSFFSGLGGAQNTMDAGGDVFGQGAISPNAGLANTIRTETESRGRVDFNFSNIPKGTEVKKSGDVPGFDLALGFAGGQ